MESHSPVNANQLWNFLRVAFFMMRRGLLSKRKLVAMEISLMMKRGKLLFGKNLASVIALHHGTKERSPPPPPDFPIPCSLHEYEFSCSNTPNPIFLHFNTKRRHSYFSCIRAAAADDNDDESPRRLATAECPAPCACGTGSTLAAGNRSRSSLLLSPFAVRVSDCSVDEGADGLTSQEVNDKAEEYIKRFYEQLMAQHHEDEGTSHQSPA